MGRHSAPDDAPDDDGPDTLAVATLSDAAVGTVTTFRQGRHARTDDESSAASESAVATDGAVATDDTMRIAAVRDDPAAASTARIDPVAPAPGSTDTAVPEAAVPEAAVPEAAVPEAGPSAVAGPGPAAPRAVGGGSAADLRLIREHADVRARCIAAVVVPFAAYVAVFAALGRLGVSALLWIWIPLITAGVLVGVFLDAGHKRYDTGGSTAAAD